MRVLIVRPAPGNAATAAAIAAMGLEPVAVPLFEVGPRAWDAPDPAEFDAVAMTSANAARHGGAGLAQFAHLPVFAVGDATADAARAVGFSKIRIGSGDAGELGQQLSGRVLHFTGSDYRAIPSVAAVTVIPVYETRSLMPNTPLKADIALIHSPRAGSRFAELVFDHNATQIVAISAAAAQACGSGWAAVHVAEQPREHAMLECLRRLCEASPPELIGSNAMTAESYYEPPERRPRPLRTALIVALLAFILGAVLVTWALTRWEPARRLILPTATTPSISPALQTAPAAAPVATLTSTPAAPLSPEAVAVTESRVAGLEARLAQIDAQASNASSNAARAEGLLIAFAARRAIDRGVGLGYLEAQLRDRFAETQPRAVAAIISAAQAPVTLDALRQQLDVLTPNLAGGGPNEGWTAAAQRTLGSLFIVRKATSPSPVADDRVARARLAIEGGQVDDALAEIARLPSRAVATDWMASARRYVEAHRALDILEAAALTAPRAIPSSSPTAGPATQ